MEEEEDEEEEEEEEEELELLFFFERSDDFRKHLIIDSTTFNFLSIKDTMDVLIALRAVSASNAGFRRVTKERIALIITRSEGV